MLSLAKEEIAPIDPVANEFDPTADVTKIGSWGLVYLVCGLVAGQSFYWSSRVFDLIPTDYETFREWMSGRTSEIGLAMEFQTNVLEWARDPGCLAIARTRLANFERQRGQPLTDKARAGFVDSARIAIMLNSVSDVEIDSLRPIRAWAKEHHDGWPSLFYAAGILLNSERTFPARSVTTGVLMFSHSAKEKLKQLLKHYSQRDSWHVV